MDSLNLLSVGTNLSKGLHYYSELQKVNRDADSLNSVISYKDSVIEILGQEKIKADLQKDGCEQEIKNLYFLLKQLEFRDSIHKAYIQLPFYKKAFIRKKNILQ